jgi:acetyl esterase
MKKRTIKERKPIDPALRRFLDEQAAALKGSPPPMTNEALVRMGRTFMVQALEIRGQIAGLPNGVETRDVEIGSGLGARLYLPPGTTKPLPLLVYIHGGGWVLGSVASSDPFCRLLGEATGIIIASVEYRLAPEHPYPASLEDTLTAVRWATEHAGEWGGDVSRIALGGDSAGANLAAVAANQLYGQGADCPLRALMLLYPVTDHPSAGHPSYSEYASGYGVIEANLMHWFWKQYAPDVSPNDPNVSPLRIKEVPPLPSTLVATAEYDVLRDEGIAYADKLITAGIAVTHLHASDMSHDFPAMPDLVARFPQCSVALAGIASWLKATLYSSSIL